MNFLTKDDDLLKKYNDIWNKISHSIKKNLIANPPTLNFFLKTKTSSYGDEPTDFMLEKYLKQALIIFLVRRVN